MEYSGLLRRSIIALGFGAVAVALCYWFVDRPVAFFVYDRHINHIAALRWLTLVPPVVQAWSPAVLAALAARRAWGRLTHWQLALAAACVAIIVADQFRMSLQVVAGRDWPETWIDDNPSLIGSGTYGFHWFAGSARYGSFPSGHAARTLAVVTVAWLAFPRWRWLGALIALAEGVALVGMNYHFVGDVLAGGVLGGIVGAYTANGFGVTSSPPPPGPRSRDAGRSSTPPSA